MTTSEGERRLSEIRRDRLDAAQTVCEVVGDLGEVRVWAANESDP